MACKKKEFINKDFNRSSKSKQMAKKDKKVALLSDKELLELIQSKGIGKDLELMSVKDSTYDAVSKKTIAEFKCRSEECETHILEALKLVNNFHFSQVIGKTFMYVVKTPSKILVFNITELMKQNTVQFKTALMPKTTLGESDEKIYKLVTYIHTRQAILSIDL